MRQLIRRVSGSSRNIMTTQKKVNRVIVTTKNDATFCELRDCNERVSLRAKLGTNHGSVYALRIAKIHVKVLAPFERRQHFDEKTLVLQ